MNRIPSLLGIAIGLVVLVGLCRSSLGIVLTTPNQFCWLLSDADYDKIIGQPNVAEVLLGRGVMLLNDDKLNEAAQCFWRVVELHSSSSVRKTHTEVGLAYYYLGKTYLLSGKPELARGLFALAIDSYPAGEFIQAQVDLSYCLDDAVRQRLRNFALARQLELQTGPVKESTKTQDW